MPAFAMMIRVHNLSSVLLTSFTELDIGHSRLTSKSSPSAFCPPVMALVKKFMKYVTRLGGSKTSMNDLPPLSKEMALWTNKLFMDGSRSLGLSVIQDFDKTRSISPGHFRPPSSKMAMHSTGDAKTTIDIPDSGREVLGTAVLSSVSG